MSTSTFALIDCDGGSDDAWALFLLLKASENLKTHGRTLDLLGITITGCGNTDLYNAARNMLRILKACGREDVPLYFGASESLVPVCTPRSNLNLFHGVDGFGDILTQEISNAEIDNIVQKKHAVIAIQEICQKHHQEVNIMALGPLTNIALCYSIYGNMFANSVAHIFIMGGNYQGVGNFTRAAEFNFYSDPEAAHIVLAKSKSSITIVPWEACTEDRFTVDINWRLNELGKAAETNSVVELLNKVERSQWTKQNSNIWNPCDLFAVMVFLFGQSVVNKSSKWHATVDLNGMHTRGQMILDHMRNFDKNPLNIILIEHLDVEIFKDIVAWVAGIEELKVKFSI